MNGTAMTGSIDSMAPAPRRTRSTDCTTPANRAVAARLAGRHARAFAWWVRAARAGDGDAWLEIGYALQHAIGVRRDVGRAARAYRRAIRSTAVTGYGQEEACYHLATRLLARETSRARREAVTLLERASADNDYWQAARLLAALKVDRPVAVCHCRRHLRRPPRWTWCERHRRDQPASRSRTARR